MILTNSSCAVRFSVHGCPAAAPELCSCAVCSTWPKACLIHRFRARLRHSVRVVHRSTTIITRGRAHQTISGGTVHMKIMALTVRLAAFAVLTLAGCSAETDSKPAPGPTPLPATPTTPDGPATNKQGRIEKQIGEEGGFGDSFSFTVNKIRIASECNGGRSPENGEYVFVDVSFETSADYATATSNNVSPKAEIDGVMNPLNWKAINPDGTVDSELDIGYRCAENSTEGFGGGYDPASSYKGTYVFDVLPGTSKIILTAHPRISWEWAIPAPS